jgi:hypothetical protein
MAASGHDVTRALFEQYPHAKRCRDVFRPHMAPLPRPGVGPAHSARPCGHDGGRAPARRAVGGRPPVKRTAAWSAKDGMARPGSGRQATERRRARPMCWRSCARPRWRRPAFGTR